jgi:hypothetical protein
MGSDSDAEKREHGGRFLGEAEPSPGERRFCENVPKIAGIWCAKAGDRLPQPASRPCFQQAVPQSEAQSLADWPDQCARARAARHAGPGYWTPMPRDGWRSWRAGPGGCHGEEPWARSRSTAATAWLPPSRARSPTRPQPQGMPAAPGSVALRARWTGPTIPSREHHAKNRIAAGASARFRQAGEEP